MDKLTARRALDAASRTYWAAIRDHGHGSQEAREAFEVHDICHAIFKALP